MNIERTARRRIHLIKRAELLKSIAEGCLYDGIDAPEPSSLPDAVTCAAKFYGLAANEYRSAGLGLLARKCWRENAGGCSSRIERTLSATRGSVASIESRHGLAVHHHRLGEHHSRADYGHALPLLLGLSNTAMRLRS